MAQRELSVRVGVNATNATAHLKNLNSEIKKVKSEFEKAGAGIENFENTASGLTAKMKSLSEQIESIKSKQQVYNKQLEIAQKTNEEASLAYQKQVDKIKALEGQLTRAQQMYGKNSAVVEKYAKAHGKAVKEIDVMGKAVINSEARINNLNTSMNKAAAEIKELNSEIGKTSTEFNKIKVDDVAEDMRQLANSASLIKELDSEIRVLATDYNKLASSSEKFEKTVYGMGEKLKFLTNQLDMAEMKQSEYNKMIELTARENERAVKAYNEQARSVKRIEGYLETSKNAYGENSAKVKDLQIELNGAKDKLHELGQAVSVSNVKLNELKAKSNETSTNMQKLKNEMTQASKAINTMKFDTVVRDLEKLSNTANKLKELDSKLKLISSQFNLAGAGVKKFAGSMGELEAKSKMLSNNISVLEKKQGQYAEAIKASVRENERASQAYSKQVQHIKTLESALAGSKNQVGQNAQEFSRLEAELEQANQELSELYNKSSQANTNLNNLRAEMNEAKSATANFRRELQQVNNSLAGKNWTNFGNNIGKAGGALTTVGNGMKNVAGGLSSLTMPLTAMSGVTAGMALEFDKSLGKIETITKGSAKGIREYEAEIKNLSISTGVYMADFAEAMYEAVSSGIALDDGLLDFTETAGKLTHAGFTDLTTAVDGLTSVMNAYGIETKDVSKIADKFVATQDKGKLTVDELARVIGTVTPIAKNAGVSLDDLFGAIAALTAGGYSASEAVTAVKGVITTFLKPTEKAKEVAAELGIEFNSNALASKGLKGALDEVGKATKGNSGLMARLFGNVRALAGAQALTGEQSEYFAKSIDAIATSTNTTNEAFEIMTNTTEGKLQMSIVKLKNSFLELGQKLAPLVQGMVEGLTRLVDWFNNLSPAMQSFLIKLGGFLIIGTPILMMLGSLTTVLGGVFSAVGFVAKRFGEAGGAVNFFKDKLSIFGGTADTAGGKVTALGGKFAGLSKLMTNPYVLVGALAALLAKLGESESALLSLQEKFGGFGMVISGIAEFISGVWDMTIGNIVVTTMLLSDILAAIFDGPGGQKVSDAFQRYGDRLVIKNNEAMAKLSLSTTTGMQTLRNMSDEQLNQLTTTFDMSLSNLSLVGSGHFGEFATNVATSLTGMSGWSIQTLQNMNDQTRIIFAGINESMTVEQKAGAILANLETMKGAGILDVNELKNGIQSAMQMANSQLDVKPATDKVGSDLANMANIGSAEAAKMAGNVATEAAKIPGAVQPVNQVPGIVQDAMNSANSVNSNGYTQMQQNTINQLGNMLNDIRGKFHDMINAMVNIVNSGVGQVDAAFMRVFNAVKNIMINLKIEVSNQMQAIRAQLSQPMNIRVNRTITTQTVAAAQTLAEGAGQMNERVKGYKISGRTLVSEPTVKTTTTQGDNTVLEALLEQNRLLMQLIGVAQEDKKVYLENTITMDSRVVAKQTAPYMQNELDTLQRRKARLGGK